MNALPPAAVAGGNVETSQRMVDTLFRALAKAAPSRIPAASQGTMNNFTLGGRDPRSGNAPFAYYETIAGGMGARPGLDGISGVHTHMTNSWNTPIEVFEQTYPLRVRKYAIRQNSGGDGKISRRRRNHPRDRIAYSHAGWNFERPPRTRPLRASRRRGREAREE